jgi:hypothetical protein
MRTQAQETKQQIANVIHELEVIEYVSDVFRERTPVAHQTDKKYSLVNHIYRSYKPQCRLQSQRVNEPQNR